jgi:hypothetical protein
MKGHLIVYNVTNHLKERFIWKITGSSTQVKSHLTVFTVEIHLPQKKL